jgi:hypothetical protein
MLSQELRHRRHVRTVVVSVKDLDADADTDPDADAYADAYADSYADRHAWTSTSFSG